MALNLLLSYPGQVSSGDPGYPYGKPRNVTVPGDGSGTPWEQLLVRDIIGFLQATIVAAGVTPSNAPDQVGSSQYLVSLLALAKKTIEESAPLHLQNDLEVDGELRVHGSRFIGVALFEQRPVFQAGFTANQSCEFVAGAEITNMVVHGTVLSDAAWGQAAPINLSGTGRIKKRVAYLTNVNSTYSIDTADKFVARQLVVTAAREYVINNAELGNEVEFINWTTFTHTLKNQASGLIGTLPAASLTAPGVVTLQYADDGNGLRWTVLYRQAP
jgi:hypothetical protein